MSDFLVTVGVATRNRLYYMEKVFEQIYKLGKQVQIVISDNSDDNTLEKTLSKYIDGNRVIYVYTKGRISVVENYNKTAEFATGKYYICIGDDDIVLPYIIDVAKWMERKSIDAVKTSREVTYIWPGASSKFGRVSLTSISTRNYKFDSEQGVIDVLKSGCQDYITANMVGSYHALVAMERMNQVRKKTGYYFAGFSPDIYSATCLCLLDNMKCMYIDFPVSVPGSCVYSATNRASKSIAISSVEEAISKYSTPEYKWGEEIPYYYTPETTWAETMIKAVKDMKRQDLLVFFNKKQLVNELYSRWTSHREEIERILTEDEKKMIDMGQEESIKSKYSVFRKFMRRFNGEVKDIFFVVNSEQAEKKINCNIDKIIKMIDWDIYGDDANGK